MGGEDADGAGHGVGVVIADSQEGGPVSAGPPPPLTCAWCPEPAVTAIEVEPARIGARHGLKCLIAREITAPACREHAAVAADRPPVVPRARARKPGPDQLTLGGV